MTAYWESTEPGAGRRAPRVDAPSDARVRSLNGDWAFRLSPTAEGTGPAFVEDDFDDSAWDRMRVPSHWVLEEFSPLAGGPARSARGTAEGPLYTNTAFPVPLDPPRIPSENPTGDYRLVFDEPDGMAAAILRFRGVDSCAKVWLNGRELGWSTGSRLPFEFDVRVRPGRNVLAVRVHRWSAGTYLEDQDMWWLPGIFRDVELIERPDEAIDDFFVHADFEPGTGMGTLRVDCATRATVVIPELGIRLQTGRATTVPVEPWSADRPRLYRGELRSAGETVPLAIGFRRVEIRDGVLLANGRPLTFRGVNRHEHHPDTGRTLDRETMIRDIELMKRANIDAVRTSHYPPHPDFLRLCDEYGLWVVEECDLETHGFIFAGWQGNPPAEEVWTAALLDRARRMVERDKNHPSVVVWSLANESGSGPGFGVLESWIRERDPSRPLLYERDPSYRHSDFYALMYPSLEELERIGRREEEAPEGASEADDERRRGLPFLLIEYAHAMGNGPGSLGDYWRILSAHDRLCGGFVWEWIDHGFRAHDEAGRPYIMHGDDVDYEPRGGRFSLHGLVFSDRTPTPGLVQLAKAYEPVGLEIAPDGGAAAVTVLNARHTADTADLAFRWRLESDGIEAGSGSLDVPVLAPGERATVGLPPWVQERIAAKRAGAGGIGARDDDARGDGREWLVTVEAVLVRDTAWAPAGHRVAFGQGVVVERALSDAAASERALSHPVDSGASDAGAVSGPEAARGPEAVRESEAVRGPAVARGPEADPSTSALPAAAAGRRPQPASIPVGNAVFDGRTGRLRRIGALELDGPWLDLHRAPTENDHGQGELNDLVSVWHATGLDRMLHRTDSIRHGEDWISVSGRTAPAAHPHAVEWTMSWRAAGAGLVLSAAVEFTGPWADTPYRHLDIWVPRLGLRFALPGAYADAEWYGRGPLETYADSFEGAQLGRFRLPVDDLGVDYPVPQENGNHVETRWLRLSGSGVPDLLVDGLPRFDFTARRWTSGDLERARRPSELRDSGRVWLNVDHAQQGLGSASVGPALPERYRIPRVPTRWRVRIATV